MDYQTTLAYIAERSGKKKAAVETLVQIRREKLNMIIDKEAGVRLVANDLAIELPSTENDSSPPKTKTTGQLSRPADIFTIQSIEEMAAIKDNSLITITLGVYYVREPREFTRKKDGSIGRVAFAGVFDLDGNKTRIIFWDDQCKLIKDLSTGDELLIESAKVRKATYGRAATDGKKELHAINSTVITKLGTLNIPEKVKSGIKSTLLRLHEIKNQHNIVTGGEVVSIDETREFRRKDGSTGRLTTLIIRDPETDKQVTVILWGDKARAVDGMYKGVSVTVRGYAKNGEIHISNYGHIEIVSTTEALKSIMEETIKQ